jgi:putative phage-type endonuclease
MKTHDITQGTQEWLDLRASHYTASEAPAAAGVSKYKSRTALLKEKAMGNGETHSDSTQRLFQRGHDAEAAARPIIEAMIDDELFPATITETISGLQLLASLDGITMDGETIWEHKLWSAELAARVQAEDLDPHYWYQLEQQLMVTCAKKAVFTCSDGTAENMVSMNYYPQPERQKQVVAAWTQFAADLAAFEHTPEAVKPAAASIEALPALLVQVEGRVLTSNLDQFKETALTFIAGIKTELVTDQDFVDADKMAKFLKDGEDRLELAKQHALAQTASIDDLFRAIDHIKEEMRSKRLALDKRVKAEKENRKAELLAATQKAFADYVANLQSRTGIMPPATAITGNAFADSIKGLKTLDSMRDKLAATLANAKIKAVEIADGIQANLNRYADLAVGYEFLFPDVLKLAMDKRLDDFEATVQNRLNQHHEQRKAEAARQAEAPPPVHIAQEPVQEPVAMTPAQKQAAVVEHQDEIGSFIKSRDFKDESRIRAILVEFVKHQAAFNLRKAA